MSGGMPTERQLAALEQRVLARIRRRATIRNRVASGLAAAALVVGGVVLVHPTVGTLSGASSGSGGSQAGPASSAVAVRCHATSDADSAVRTVPLPARPSVTSIAAACDEQLSASGSTSRPSAPAGLPPRVVCRSAKGVWEVFPDDGHPSTLCSRNALRTG
jgi:hypothetical protein